MSDLDPPMLRWLLLLLVAASTLHAQDTSSASRRMPDAQFGVGLHTRGLAMQYAITSLVHAGVHATVNHTTSEGASATALGAMPFVKVIVDGFVSPFAELGVELAFTSSRAHWTTTTQWTTSIVALVGLEHYVARTLGVYVATELVNAQVDPVPTSLSLGVFHPRAGIEWFFGGGL